MIVINEHHISEINIILNAMEHINKKIRSHRLAGYIINLRNIIDLMVEKSKQRREK